jgi:predicted membrane protein
MRNKLSNSIWGIIFIVLGVGYAGKALNMWDFNPFFEGWWTMFIIIPCAVSMLRGGFRVGSTMGFIIGVMLLASYYISINFSVWNLIIPAVLILIGLRIIFQGSFHHIHMEHRVHTEGGSGAGFSSANKGEYSAIFASNNVRITDQFNGTNLNAIFGAIVLDLRDAAISGDVEITATAVFGGIDIFVPRGVQVKVNNVPIFGGVSNKTGYQAAPGAPVIYLNSTCMFGGIDIK